VTWTSFAAPGGAALPVLPAVWRVRLSAHRLRAAARAEAKPGGAKRCGAWGVSDQVPMRPIVPAPEPYGYRNRIRVHVAGGVVGFLRTRLHALIDNRGCPIATPEVNQALGPLPASHPRMAICTISAPDRPAFSSKRTHQWRGCSYRRFAMP